MLELNRILAWYTFSELMQRIFKYGDIQNNRLTLHKELNILIYGTPCYFIIYRSYKLPIIVVFLANPAGSTVFMHVLSV